jgi:hypothetical protein
MMQGTLFMRTACQRWAQDNSGISKKLTAPYTSNGAKLPNQHPKLVFLSYFCAALCAK